MILLTMSLASAAAFMKPAFESTPLAIDEHISFWIADSAGPGTLWDRSLNYSATPPLSSMLQWLFLQTAGHSEAVFRASSVVCFFLAIVATWMVGRELFGELAGGLAALLLAWNPEVLEPVRLARPYGLCVFLGSLSVFLTARWQKQPDSLKLQYSWTLTCIALIWTHYLNTPFVALLWIGIWGSRWLPTSVDRGRLLQSAIFIALFCLPLLPSLMRLQEWSPLLNYHIQGPSILDVLHPVWTIALPCGVIVALLTGTYRRDEPVEKTVLIDVHRLCFWAVVPLLLAMFATRGEMTTLALPRYRAVYAPVIALLFAGIFALRFRAGGALASTIACIAAFSYLSDSAPWHSEALDSPNPSIWMEMSEIIQRDGQPNELVFVQTGMAEAALTGALFEDSLFMDYVSCRLGRFYLRQRVHREGLPHIALNKTQVYSFYESTIDNETGQDSSLWVAAAIDTAPNRNSLTWIKTMVESRGFERVDEFTFQSAVLLRYRRLPK